MSYIATDIHGNTTTLTFTITVLDDIPPIISGMPADITQTADADTCGAVVNWTAPTASDNCTLDTLTADYASGDFFPLGTTTVTYTATDSSGNVTTSSFTVSVTLTESPTISGCLLYTSDAADE